MGITIREQANNLNRSIKEFVECIDSLPEALYLKKIDDWTPRDVLAHLIGWNRYTMEGCQRIREGETPFHFVDPGDDFSKVNAVLVREYDSRDKRRIIKELEVSAQEVEQFLLSVNSTEWETDYGVTYKGGSVTVRNMIDALNYDYVDHRRQIEKWAESVEELK